MNPAADPLTPARAQIDRLDRRMVALLARRQAWVATIALLKGDPSLALDSRRARAVIRRVRRRALRTGLDPDLAEAVWTTLLDRSAAQEVDMLRAAANLRLTKIKGERAPTG